MAEKNGQRRVEEARGHGQQGRSALPCSDGTRDVVFFMIKQRNIGDIMKHTAYTTVI